MMTWPKLLNWHRLQDPRKEPIKPMRSPWQVDYDRVIFSSAFRRLQDKTQVFPLSESDYVRTRLTHTLEVSTVARTLGTMAGALVLDRHGNEKVDNDGRRARLAGTISAGNFGEIVAAAALAHDLGNPPFGHSGEDAVRHWFESSSLLADTKQRLNSAKQQDFKSWEGNAQGFRILTRLQLYREEGGMRLTHSTLAAFTKYPTLSTSVENTPEGTAISRKKFGFFKEDLPSFQQVAIATGLIPRVGVAASWCRHPLAFLTEAADDLCYGIVDLEDGCRLHRVPYSMAKDHIQDIAKVAARNLYRQPNDTSRMGYLRAVAIRVLVEQVAAAFRDYEDPILAGRFERSLVDVIPCAKAFQAIKDLSRNRIYSMPGVIEVEAAGFEIIPGLLDRFWSALNVNKPAPAYRQAKKLRQLLPSEVITAYPGARDDEYAKMLRLADFVTGMTDSYALSLYRKLQGIALPT